MDLLSTATSYVANGPLAFKVAAATAAVVLAAKFISSARASANKWQLKGKVLLITGASSGIGKEFACEAARRGASGLILAARGAEALNEVAASCKAIDSNVKVCVVVSDVGKQEDCKKIVEEGVKAFGKIDCLFLNAGISMGDMFEDVKDVEIYDKLMKVNYFQVVWICHYALKYIKEAKGRIAAVSSGLGKIALPSRSGYSASKFALQGFIDCLRREIYDTGVKVTLICPGVIKTDIDSRRLGADGKIGTAKAKLNGKGNMTADTCARICLDAIQYGQREAYPAFSLEYKFIGPLQLFFPNLTDRIGAAFGRKLVSNSEN